MAVRPYEAKIWRNKKFKEKEMERWIKKETKELNVDEEIRGSFLERQKDNIKGEEHVLQWQ